jgi:hypothetical protein
MTAPMPPRAALTCPWGHVTRTRQPEGSQLACVRCSLEGRKQVMVTVTAQLPSVRPPLPATPEAIATITRRKTGPPRWYCSACQGSALCPEPGEPVPGWLEIRADGTVLATACTPEHAALLLPRIRDELEARPWTPPDPGPGGSVAKLIREIPAGRR